MGIIKSEDFTGDITAVVLGKARILLLFNSNGK